MVLINNTPVKITLFLIKPIEVRGKKTKTIVINGSGKSVALPDSVLKESSIQRKIKNGVVSVLGQDQKKPTPPQTNALKNDEPKGESKSPDHEPTKPKGGGDDEKKSLKK